MAFNPVTGNWPAIWMVPVTMIDSTPAYSLTTGGEIDVFEWFSNASNKFWGTLHTWDNGVDTATSSPNSWAVPEGTSFANYNTYGILWTPTAISWYFNNSFLGTVSTTSAPYNSAFNGSGPYFLILSEQAGCNGVYTIFTPCSGQASPLNMQVQWVHIYSK